MSNDPEETYPLVNATDPEGNTAPVLPNPVPTYSRRRNRSGPAAFFHRIRAKWHSTRPLVRALIIFAVLAIPLYRLSLYARGSLLSGGKIGGPWDEEPDVNPGPLPDMGHPVPDKGSPVPDKGHDDSKTGGDSIWEKRAQEVKAAFVHAYSNYEKYAFPADELLPLSKGKVNKLSASRTPLILS